MDDNDAGEEVLSQATNTVLVTTRVRQKGKAKTRASESAEQARLANGAQESRRGFRGLCGGEKV